MTEESASRWQPSATLDQLRRRADLLSAIRRFFSVRGVLEVETPLLSSSATVEPHLESFRVSDSTFSPDGPLYLHTSPEFPMKRLLAAGSGPIYQICKVFRDGERGRHHNPEFTLLEWYRPGFDHFQLMGEVAELIGTLAGGETPAAVSLSYRQAFLELAGVDPFGPSDSLRRYVEDAGIEHQGAPAGEQEAPDYWRDLILVHRIEPRLDRDRLTFLYDYPASQASLARVRDGDPPLADRFELYWRGMELANGFHELRDADELARRFAADQAERARLGLKPVREDRRLLAALQAGLPPCSGVALGIDRLLMALSGATRIDEVLAFPIDRA
ncbi:MAG: elongation factor P--(R)-beta-lysine ligase [Gammaproteobacteria bacterium]